MEGKETEDLDVSIKLECEVDGVANTKYATILLWCQIEEYDIIVAFKEKDSLG